MKRYRENLARVVPDLAEHGSRRSGAFGASRAGKYSIRSAR